MKPKLWMSGVLLAASGWIAGAEPATAKPETETEYALVETAAPAEGSFCLALPLIRHNAAGEIEKSYWGLIAGTPQASQIGGVVLSVYSESRAVNYYAMYLALAVASARSNFGIEISPVLAFADNNYGLLPASFGMIRHNYGMYCGFLSAFASENYALSLSGLVNVAYRNYGVQLAPFNRVVAENRGVQLGAFNLATPQSPDGIRVPVDETDAEAAPAGDARNFLQIGVFNGNRLPGPSLQFGLLNYDPGARIPWLPFCNWK